MGQYGRHRFLEIIPGALVWSAFVFALLASFFWPAGAIVFIIIFDLYWLLRVVYFIVHLLAAYVKYRRVVAVNWMDRLGELPDWERITHVVFLPTYKEEFSIVEASVRALAQSEYPADRMIVVVGGEEGDKENFLGYAARLEKDFAGVFRHLMCTVHPKGMPGEIPGKGSNMRFMGHEVKKYIDEQGLPYDDIIASAFDIDTVAHEHYFARLTYVYLTTPNPTRSSYQPLTLFSNNIWSATAPVRIAAFGTTFWLLAELSRPERLWTFSSHSSPWRMLVDVGFWEPDMVTEDSRIFLQALIHYRGDYRVTPLFLPVSMDAVAGDTYWESLVALYKQHRRWAWSVEHFPYMVTKFREHTDIPWWTRFRFLFDRIEGTFTWATAPILIFILGYVPFWTVGESENVLIANSPFTLEWIMRFAMIGVFVTGGLSFLLLPPRPAHHARSQWLVMVAQWVLLPVTTIVFGALPAIDAQTRLMLGKYLGFNVTKKKAASRQIGL